MTIPDLLASLGEKMNERQILFRIAFMHAQVSGIFGSIKHILRGSEPVADSRANMAFVKSEIGDLIKQTHLLVEQLGLDYQECDQLGTERYDESKAEWEKRGYGDKWV